MSFEKSFRAEIVEVANKEGVSAERKAELLELANDDVKSYLLAAKFMQETANGLDMAEWLEKELLN